MPVGAGVNDGPGPGEDGDEECRHAPCGVNFWWLTFEERPSQHAVT